MQPMPYAQDKKAWTMPILTVHGSLASITEAFNKVGKSSDHYTMLTGGVVIGSLVPAPK